MFLASCLSRTALRLGHVMAPTRARSIGSWLRAPWIRAALLIGAMVVPAPSTAQQISDALAARLTPDQHRAYTLYLKVRSAYDREVQAYWAAIEDKRDGRRRKRAQGQAFARADYVA